MRTNPRGTLGSMSTRPLDRWWVAALGALLLALAFPFIPRSFRGDAGVMDVGALIAWTGVGALVGAAGGIVAASRINAAAGADGGTTAIRNALWIAVALFAVAVVLRMFVPIAAAGLAALVVGFALALLTIRALALRRRGRGET